LSAFFTMIAASFLGSLGGASTMIGSHAALRNTQTSWPENCNRFARTSRNGTTEEDDLQPRSVPIYAAWKPAARLQDLQVVPGLLLFLLTLPDGSKTIRLVQDMNHETNPPAYDEFLANLASVLY
jgi:hypothetical protein